jgi:excisionase family DNA binding protein
MTAEERWVGVEDVARHLGVNKDSVYRWIEKMGLPAHRLGRLFRFKISEVDEWVRQDNDLPAPRSLSRQAGLEKSSNPVQDRPLSESQTIKSTPKTRSQKRDGNG